MTEKIVVFGDTGGHAKVLFAALRKLGVDLESYVIPEHLTIIHLGDIIHKGPSSDLLIEKINHLMLNNPNRWVQILGNHEFQHIKGAPYFWQCTCTAETLQTINNWWNTGLAKATYGLDNIKPPALEVSAKPKLVAANTSWFFSHAGLTYYWWKEMGSPTSAAYTAELLNELSVKEITIPGAMLGYPNFKAGPVWAIGNSEVFNSWKDHDVAPPFSQIHGHTTSYLWTQGRWWDSSRRMVPFRKSSKVNPETKAVITDLGKNNLMVGIDPGYGKIATDKEQPYVTLERVYL